MRYQSQNNSQWVFLWDWWKSLHIISASFFIVFLDNKYGLYCLILPLETRLFLKTHLHPSLFEFFSNWTRSQTLLYSMDFNSSFMASIHLLDSVLSMVDFLNDTICGSYASDTCALVHSWSVSPKYFSTLLKCSLTRGTTFVIGAEAGTFMGNKIFTFTSLIFTLCCTILQLTSPFSRNYANEPRHCHDLLYFL